MFLALMSMHHNVPASKRAMRCLRGTNKIIFADLKASKSHEIGRLFEVLDFIFYDSIPFHDHRANIMS